MNSECNGSLRKLKEEKSLDEATAVLEIMRQDWLQMGRPFLLQLVRREATHQRFFITKPLEALTPLRQSHISFIIYITTKQNGIHNII
jgi:hypothetical protein